MSNLYALFQPQRPILLVRSLFQALCLLLVTQIQGKVSSGALTRLNHLSVTDHLGSMDGLTAFKSRAQNLFMIGRRETSKPEKPQDSSKRFLRTSALQKLTPSVTIATKLPGHALDSQSQRG